MFCPADSALTKQLFEDYPFVGQLSSLVCALILGHRGWGRNINFCFVYCYYSVEVMFAIMLFTAF